jgi:hypothetical protein
MRPHFHSPSFWGNLGQMILEKVEPNPSINENKEIKDIK